MLVFWGDYVERDGKKNLRWGWVGPVAISVFVYTDNPLPNMNCLKILWSKLKGEQKEYILAFFTNSIILLF